MPEDNPNIEPTPNTRPTYSDADLPIWDEGGESVVPSLPERKTPSNRPVYKDEDLPVWKDDKDK